MTIKALVILISVNLILSSHSIADDFPNDRIAKLLKNAYKPVVVDVRHIEPGTAVVVEYLDLPIWIIRRTEEDLNYLSKNYVKSLADPRSKNMQASIEAAYQSSISVVNARVLLFGQPETESKQYRSKKAEYLVVGRWGPDTGCLLYYHAPNERKIPGAAFIDPCAHTSYDLAGRVYRSTLKAGPREGQSAKFNLYIPPYRFSQDGKLVIGVPQGRKLPKMEISKVKQYGGLNPTERLIVAAAHNDIEVVKQSIRDGANAGYYEFRKATPLRSGIIGGSFEIIKLLLKNGAKPDEGAIELAKSVNRPEVVELLESIN